MTLTSQSLSCHKWFFNLLEKTCSESVARRGLRLSVYYSIVRYELTMRYSSCYQNSQFHLFRAEDTSLALDIFMQSKKKAAANSKDAVKISRRQLAQVWGHSNTTCHGSMFSGPRQVTSSPAIIATYVCEYIAEESYFCFKKKTKRKSTPIYFADKNGYNYVRRWLGGFSQIGSVMYV